MKKLIFLTIAIMLLFSLRCHAATLYVRQGGADYPTCDGSTNVDYADRAAGTDNCAFNHPAWLTGVKTDSVAGSSGRLSAGDTGIVSNGSYFIGYGMPNSSGVCNSGYTYDCYLKAPPSGSVGAETKMIGCSASGCANAGDYPELHLVGRLNKMMSLNSASYVQISDFDITDHWGSSAECSAGLPIQTCGRLAFFADNHLWHHITFSNINIHGLQLRGFLMGTNPHTGTAGTPPADIALTFDNVRVRACGQAGIDFDTCGPNETPDDYNDGKCGFNGNITFTDTVVSFNGCRESYPLSDTGDNIIYNSCKEGNNGGYGDGIAANDTGGTWLFTNCTVEYNTSDGVDLLYFGNTDDYTYTYGSVIFRGGRYEGSNGNQIKSGVRDTRIYSTLILGNSYYFWQDNEMVYPGFVVQRAGGTPLVIGSKGGSSNYPKIYNSTIASNGDVMVEAGLAITASNNIFQGGRQFNQDRYYFPYGDSEDKVAFYYGGTSFSGDYNICYGDFKTGTDGGFCTAGTNQTVNPQFTGTIQQGPKYGGGIGYYSIESGYQSNYYEQFPIGVASPARDAADETAQTYWAYDANGLARGASWDIGAYEYESTSQDVCDSTHCNLCLTSGTCGDASCYWWTSDLSCHGVAETCNNNCDLCAEDQTTCSASTKPCYWWHSTVTCESVAEGCNDDCDDCFDENACTGSTIGTCEWKRSTGDCGTVAETCAEHYSRCLTEATCEAQLHYWYNNTCNLTPEGWEQAVKWDTVATGTAIDDSVVTVPITVGDNDYRMLIVGIGYEPSTIPTSISSVTSSNVDCTEIDTQGFGASQVYLETFEDQAYTALTETETSGTNTIQGTNLYEGSYSSKHVASAGGSAYVKQTTLLTGYSRTTAYARWKFKIPAGWTGIDSIDIFRFRDTYPATLSLLGIGSDRTLYIYNSANATTYPTTYEVPLDEYIDIVYGTYVHDTAGWIKLWVDDVLITSQTGIDTRKTVTSSYVGQADVGIVVNDDADTEATLYVDNFELNTFLDRNGYVSMYYCLPDIGDLNVVATLSNAVAGINMGVISIAGVNQNAPGSAKASGTGTTASTSPTTTADSSWLFDVVGNVLGGNMTASTGQTERYALAEGIGMEGGTEAIQTAGATTSSWTVSSDSWGMITATVEPGSEVLPVDDCSTICTLCADQGECSGSDAGCYWWNTEECQPNPQTFVTGCTFTGVTLK